MNTIILKGINSTKIYRNVGMLVFGMGGTTVNEKNIVYDVIHKTIKNFGMSKKKEIERLQGYDKYEIINHFLIKNSNNKINIDINYLTKRNL